MVITASTELASSAGDFATLAPASVSGLILSGVLFQTVSAWPPSISRPLMFEPIRPMPAMPMCIRRSFRLCGANDRQSGPRPEAALVVRARSALARRMRRPSVRHRLEDSAAGQGMEWDDESGKGEEECGRDRAWHHGRLVFPQPDQNWLARRWFRYRRGEAQGAWQGQRRDRAERP